MPILPRSALLAAWGGAAIGGRVGLDQAVRTVQALDEPHAVEAVDQVALDATLAAASSADGELAGLLSRLRASGVVGLRVALPAPGDVRGLPGPADVNVEALEAGECVLTVGGPPLALVPSIEEFGSAYETGYLVTWRVHLTQPLRVPDVASLAEAELQLRHALISATEAISDLDVARWRPDAAARIGGLRSGRGPTALLPPTAAPRSARVLDLAWRVRGIVELAREDDGGAISGWEATRRAQALNGLDDVGRRAVVAAINASLEPHP